MSETQSTQVSTPITAEGLRGLGMNVYERLAVARIGDVRLDVWDDYKVGFGGFLVGTAPDLETVGRLIEVLRRMNGGG